MVVSLLFKESTGSVGPLETTAQTVSLSLASMQGHVHISLQLLVGPGNFLTFLG